MHAEYPSDNFLKQETIHLASMNTIGLQSIVFIMGLFIKEDAVFETHNSSELPNFLLPAGGHMWKTVGLRLNMLWFHVKYKVKTNDEIDFGILFLSKPQQVIDLQQQPGCEIDQLDIVSPGNTNGTERWKMEPVIEIWVGNEIAPMEQHKAWIYVLEDGSRYVDSCITPNENDLCDKRLVFKK